MVERETYFLSIPRRYRRKSQEETRSKEKDPEVQVVEQPPTKKKIDEIIKKMQREVYEEPLENDSYFDNVEVGATSYAKDTREKERELHLNKIKELTKKLEVSRIIERNLKKEKKMYKKNNERMIKENEKLNEKIGKLETKNTILSKQAYRWMNDKNTCKYKYER